MKQKSINAFFARPASKDAAEAANEAVPAGAADSKENQKIVKKVEVSGQRTSYLYESASQQITQNGMWWLEPAHTLARSFLAN